MKNNCTLILRNFLLLLAALFTISNLPAAAQTKLSTPRITQAIDETNLVKMNTRVHPLARPEFDQGVVADSQPMNRMMLVLQRSPQQEAALRNLLDEQQTKNSPNYHAWLTPAQFGQQFGVADADLQAITGWLTQKGFTGIKAGPDNMFIEFSGTAGTVRNAFHTEIHNFLVKGEKHMANVSVPQIPAALSPVISAVHSLHNFRKKSFMHYSQAVVKAKAEGRLKPGFGDGNGLYAVAPGDFAKIYNLPSTLNGSGQTIAIVARSNIQQTDINQFGQGFNIANLTNFTYANNIIVSGADPGIQPPDDGETTLDVEMSGSVAPGATIKVVVSDSTATTFADGVDLSAFYIVENNVGKIMSESYGMCELENGGDTFEYDLWEFAASEGISVFVSTGDTGSASCDPDLYNNVSDLGLGVNANASTPFNVAVGGTDFNDASNPTMYWSNTAALSTAKSYIPEIPWNDGCASTATAATLNTVCSNTIPIAFDPNIPTGLDLSGGGGGASNCGTVNGSGDCVPYPKPPFQLFTGLTGMPADGARDIPDVSLYAAVNSASNHSYIICLADSTAQNGQACNLTGPNYNFTGVGGTSASSPSFAGILALVNQNEVNNSRLAAGAGQGNINYVLYKLAVAQNTTPGTAMCAASTAAPNGACTFNDITQGNNSVACIGASDDGNPPNGATPNCSTAPTTSIGVLVEPSATTTPGWTATAGYDLATGLGSVNATNLVNNWHTVTTNFTPSTITITSTSPTPVNIGHGANVNFNIKVAPTSGAGTPTGDVSLIAEPTGGPNFGLNGGTLAGGTVSIPTLQLPGGTYSVVAHYGGDGTYAPSDSAPVSVTVSQESSSVTTTMYEYWNSNTSTITSAPYGSYYLFRVDVIGSQNGDNQPCSTAVAAIPCPTGTVSLSADGAPLKDFLNTATGVSTNTATLNVQGFTEDRVLGSTGLPGGAHSISATYSGDASYKASTQAAATAITIAPTATQTAVTVNGLATATVNTSQSVTLTALVLTLSPITGTISNGLGPTGSVTFSACGTAASCTVPVVPTAFTNANGSAFGTATLTTSFSAPGMQTITATYTGDTNYSSCTTPVSTPTAYCTLSSLALTVNAAATGTFAVSYSPQPLVLSSVTGAATPLLVTVTPTGGFTGTVGITPTAATLPPGVTCTPSPLNISVTGPAAVQGTLNCQVVATSTVLTASDVRENRMLEAKTVPPGMGGKGWWTLSAGTGFAALFLLFLPGGRKKYRAALGLGLVCILSLTFGCNGTSGGVIPPPKTQTTTKLTANVDKVPNLTAFMFSVAVTGGTPTGQVQLFDGTAMIGTPATVAGGSAAPTAPALAVGTHAISAHYLGDATTAASASGTLNLTVTGPTTIAITSSPAATPPAAAATVTIQ